MQGEHKTTPPEPPNYIESWFRLDIFHPQTQRIVASVRLGAEDARSIAEALGYSGEGEWRIDAYFGEDGRYA